jgi:superfamily II DNA/RNA helicase
MTHHVLAVADPSHKSGVVHELASGRGRRILFTRTKHSAKKLARQLTAAGIPAVDLHGNLSQPARERNLAAFSDGGVRVLVATDIAARGIHVDDIELVIHVDPPTEHKAYLHRSGRTARAGSGGTVVTVMLKEQTGDVRSLMRQAGITATHAPAHPGAPAVTALVGEVAERVEPVAAAPVQAQGQGRGQGQRSQGQRTSEGSGTPRRRRRARGGSGSAGSGAGAGSRSGGPAGRTPAAAPAPARSRSIVDVSRAGVPNRRRSGR